MVTKSVTVRLSALLVIAVTTGAAGAVDPDVVRFIDLIRAGDVSPDTIGAATDLVVGDSEASALLQDALQEACVRVVCDASVDRVRFLLLASLGATEGAEQVIWNLYAKHCHKARAAASSEERGFVNSYLSAARGLSLWTRAGQTVVLDTAKPERVKSILDEALSHADTLPLGYRPPACLAEALDTGSVVLAFDLRARFARVLAEHGQESEAVELAADAIQLCEIQVEDRWECFEWFVDLEAMLNSRTLSLRGALQASDPGRFDSKDWVARKKRCGMVEDLVTSRLLQWKDREEVQAILGLPDETSTESFTYRIDAMEGKGRGCPRFPGLLVAFGREGLVVETLMWQTSGIRPESRGKVLA